MFPSLHGAAALVGALAFGSAALAGEQLSVDARPLSGVVATGADPAEPAAAVPPLAYRSTFKGYRRHAEQTPGSWRELNEQVARIGGWRAYAKEAQEPPAPPTAPAAAHKQHY